MGGSITALLDTAIIRACVDVAIIDDAVHESTQHFSILMEPSLTHPNLKAGDVPIIEVTILDDDGKKIVSGNSLQACCHKDTIALPTALQSVFAYTSVIRTAFY